MNQSTFYFFAELNDFLPLHRKQVCFEVQYEGSPSVKHLIEALGVPHPEVSQILANGEAVDFTYPVQNEDRILVYPASMADQNTRLISCYMLPNEEPRFVIDNHLGRLAAYLRMLGFDALYRNDFQDDELAQVASQDSRTLLTRDRHLLMRSAVKFGYCIRHLEPRQQLFEVVRHFDLVEKIRPFQRCLRCNSPLQKVSKEEVWERLEPLTRQYYDEFHLCPACQQVYWKGSHYQRMQSLLDQVIRSAHPG